MHGRWTERIDLYLGEDLEAALEWGRRDVVIRWQEEVPAPGAPGS